MPTETRLHLVDGLHFVAHTPSGHDIALDSAGEATGAGPAPMELQMAALGGCTGMDTISILRKMRQDVTGYDLTLSAERATEHPRVYTSIQMTHRLKGRQVSEANVRRAIELTMTRYCPVFAMLSPGVDISERYEIFDEDTSSVTVGEVTLAGIEAVAPAEPG